MLDFGLEPSEQQQTVLVEDEPALEIALPQVFEQPRLLALQRGRLPHVETRAIELFRQQLAAPEAPLGPEYQELVTEFQPLFTWTTACWDYLLSTEGCRFLPRKGQQKFGVRGDYYAMTDKEYSRMVHAAFRACVFDFARQAVEEGAAQNGNGHGHARPFLGPWLRQRLWPMILEAYRRLEQPPDPRQRTLTPYSYLRCVPYQFLNEFHHDLVYSTTQHLPDPEWRAIDGYFLHFFTEPAAAAAMELPMEEWLGMLRHALMKLLVDHRLVYCLLRQIERY